MSALMIEATQNRTDDRAGLKARAPRIVDCLESWVLMAVTDGEERRRQAISMGCLIGAGLLCTVASPVLALSQAATWMVVAPLLAASLFLGATAWLSLTGALDVVAWLGGTVVLAAIGTGAVFVGGASPALVLVLAIVPAEALRRGRKRLATGLLASAAIVGYAALRGLFEPPTIVDAATIALTIFYGAALVYRSAGVQTTRGRQASTMRKPLETKTAEALDDIRGLAMRLDDDGAIGAISPSLGRLVGGDPGVLSGAPFIDLVHVADRIACLAALKDETSAGVPVSARLRCASGLYVETAFTVQREGSTGYVIRFAVLPARESDSAAKALKAALEQATQSSNAKTQFLAAVSHELRTPLNAIIGFSDILGQEIFGGFESDRQKEYVGLIRHSGQHLLSVVNGLLDVSKIEAGRYELEPESFVFGEALTQAADIVRDEAKAKKLRLDLRPGCASAQIVADRRACHQILLNLLSNAVKFTEVGVVTLESRLDGDYLQVSVSDTGIGIASEDVERLGRPFTQISNGSARRYAGTGLGLSLVKGLAELHGGTMAIASQPSIGTMVTVRLPIDCRLAGPAPSSLTENVVALDHARTKTPPVPKSHAPRRTA